MSPYFWLDFSENSNSPSSRYKLVPRHFYQILRFDLPVISSQEALQAIKFKMRTAYPAQTDLFYFVQWVSAPTGLIAYVLVCEEATHLKLSDLSEKEKIWISVPFQLPSTVEKNAIIYSKSFQHWELNVYQEGFLHQSHILKLDQNSFSDLLEKMCQDHPAHALYFLEEDGLTDPVNVVKGDRLTFQTLLTKTTLKSLSKINLMKGQGKGNPVKILSLAGSLLLLVGAMFFQVAVRDQQIEELERSGLTEAEYKSIGEKLEKTLLELEGLRKFDHLPIIEILRRVYAQTGDTFKLSGVHWNGKKLAFEGRSQNALKTLEALRENTWFRNFIPLQVRVDPVTDDEFFLLEGDLKHD